MENETLLGSSNFPWKSKDASYVDEWFLVGSPLPCFLILASYLAFILKIGPYLMKDRAPFKLTYVILAYNIFQVIVSGYMFILAVKILLKIGLAPDKCISDSEELQYEYYSGVHVYMLAKVSELLDTVFFILRKKYRQASFLHIYHHCGIFFYTWVTLALKYNIMTIIVLGFLNCFVHFIMYSYYALSVFPSISKYLWWKKYITSMQLIQFSLILLYAFFEYLTTPCAFSTAIFVQFVIHLTFVSYLFGDFYRKSYKSPQELKKE